MFCEQCGAQLKDGAKFCIKCGTPVKVRNFDKSESPQESVSGEKKIKAKKSVLPWVCVIVILLVVGGITYWKWENIQNYIAGGTWSVSEEKSKIMSEASCAETEVTENKGEKEGVKALEEKTEVSEVVEEVPAETENEIENETNSSEIWVCTGGENRIDALVYTYKHDESGNIILKEIRDMLDSSFVGIERMEYDLQGEQTKHTYHDELGNIVKRKIFTVTGNKKTIVEYGQDGSVSNSYEIELNSLGNEVKRSYYNGNGELEWEKHYEYDAQGNQISDKRYYGDGSIYMWREKEYDAQGKEISWTEYNLDREIIRRTEFNYDVNGNPTQVIYYDADGNVLKSYAPWGGLEDTSLENGHLSYEYDQNGNMTKRMMVDINGVTLRSENYENIAGNKKSDTHGVDVEGEVKKIRDRYNQIVDNISSGTYSYEVVRPGVVRYWNGPILCAVTVDKNVDGDEYKRSYYYSDGKLIFAYYEKDDSHRFYFKDSALIRWRYAEDASKADNAINHDMLTTHNYVQWEGKVLRSSELLTD